MKSNRKLIRKHKNILVECSHTTVTLINTCKKYGIAYKYAYDYSRRHNLSYIPSRKYIKITESQEKMLFAYSNTNTSLANVCKDYKIIYSTAHAFIKRHELTYARKTKFPIITYNDLSCYIISIKVYNAMIQTYNSRINRFLNSASSKYIEKLRIKINNLQQQNQYYKKSLGVRINKRLKEFDLLVERIEK